MIPRALLALAILAVLGVQGCGGGGGGHSHAAAPVVDPPAPPPPPPSYVPWADLSVAVGTYAGAMTYSGDSSWNDTHPAFAIAAGGVVTITGVYGTATTTVAMVAGDVFAGPIHYHGVDFTLKVIHHSDGALYVTLRASVSIIYQLTPTGAG